MFVFRYSIEFMGYPYSFEFMAVFQDEDEQLPFQIGVDQFCRVAIPWYRLHPEGGFMVYIKINHNLNKNL